MSAYSHWPDSDLFSVEAFPGLGEECDRESESFVVLSEDLTGLLRRRITVELDGDFPVLEAVWAVYENPELLMAHFSIRLCFVANRATVTTLIERKVREALPRGFSVALWRRGLTVLPDMATFYEKTLVHSVMVAPIDGDEAAWKRRFLPILQEIGYEQRGRREYIKRYLPES